METSDLVIDSTVVLPAGQSLPKRLRTVLPRRLVMFRVFDLPGVPFPRRSAALRLAITEWSPYTEWSAAVVWLDATTAAAWVVNREVDSVARGRSWLPESLLLASEARPIEVIRGTDGWIVRHWLDGRLSAELSFSALPDAAQWSSTMAGLGVSDADSKDAWNRLAAARPTPRLSKPWAGRVEHLDARTPARLLDVRRLMYVGGAVLAVSTLALALVWGRQWHVEVSLERSLAEARERLAPVAQERARAHDAAQKLRAWNDLDRYPAPLEVIDAFAASIPAGVVVSQFRMDAGIVRATLSNPGIQPAADLVEKLQKSGRFSNVRVVPASDPRSLQVEMELNRRPAVPKAKNAT